MIMCRDIRQIFKYFPLLSYLGVCEDLNAQTCNSSMQGEEILMRRGDGPSPASSH